MTATKLEEAFKLIAKTDQDNLRKAREQLVALRDQFAEVPVLANVEVKGMGSGTAASQMLTSFQGSLNSWRPTLDGFINQIDYQLSTYNNDE